MSQIDSNASPMQSVTSEEKNKIQNPSQSQSSNPEIAPLLLDFSNRRSSGILEIYYGNLNWKLFLEQGNLKYALMSVQNVECLNYHLRALDYKQAGEALKGIMADNRNKQKLASVAIDVIVSWLSQKQALSSEQVSTLTKRLTQEAIEPLFWLTNFNSNWEEINPETPSIAISSPFDLSSLIQECSDRVQSWQQFLDQINSPYQRPYFFKTPSQENNINPKLLKISKLMRGFSIHQLAILIKQDELKLAQMLYPHIKSGDIFLRKPENNFEQLPVIPKIASSPTATSNNSAQRKTKQIKIACVDDSPTILREMERLLGEEDYELTKISNPVEAASTLFRVKPDLVLMDISMPEINGYKLCSLLRNSNALAQVPIVMVTSRTGMIDKVRAKASGATSYLTKPFTKESLLEVIKNCLSSN